MTATRSDGRVICDTEGKVVLGDENLMEEDLKEWKRRSGTHTENFFNELCCGKFV